ncbi:MAG: hypothetical protein QM772_11290 [Ottowia sp.]|uniref:hypothetical protein n=1 Tax=Ottowia sp. TaxID=1898956 RepID=UPI0039E532EF
MRPQPLALLLAATAALTANAAHAQNIDTTAAWDGGNTMGGFGGTPTYGQTITAPAGHDRLTGFSFYIDSTGQSRAFRAAVYAWNVAQQRAVGEALWQSAPVTIASAGGHILEHAFAPPGGVPLTPEQTYVLLGTTLYDTGSGSMNWGWLMSDPYSSGGFVYLGSTDPADLTGTAWSGTGARDLVFKATFAAAPPPPPAQAAPVPVPGPQGAALALLGLAMSGATLRFRRLLRPGPRKP